MPGPTDSDTTESKRTGRAAKHDLAPPSIRSVAAGVPRPKIGVVSPPAAAAGLQVREPKARPSDPLGSMPANPSKSPPEDGTQTSFPPQTGERLATVQKRTARRRSDHLDRIYKALLALAIVVTLVSLLPRPNGDSTPANDRQAETEQVVDSGSPDAPPPEVLIQTD